MHDGMPYGRIQGQGQGHSREVDRQSPTGLFFWGGGIIEQLTYLLNIGHAYRLNSNTHLAKKSASHVRRRAKINSRIMVL